MTVRHPPVKMEAPASMGSTHSSVSAQMAGKAVYVMPVSVWFWCQLEQQPRYTALSEKPC